MFSGNAAQITDAAYIEDVFSTWLYTGTGTTQTINNGIDLAGKGGLVWMKGRSGATDHALYDTVRGATFDLASNLTSAQTTQSTGLTGFLANGFSIGTLAKINTNAATYVSWTFREQPKFFDIVTYTGTGAATQTISHALGSVPGCIMVKSTSTTGDWFVYHRGLTGGSGPNFKFLNLNTTAAESVGSSQVWGSTATDFTLYSGYGLNTNGVTYVAYLFAHGAGGFGATGADNVISCGSFTSSAGGLATVNLGYEPQWVMFKGSNGVTNWQIVDNMRGFVVGAANSGTSFLNANTAAAEGTNPPVGITNTGFDFNGASNITYIYIAIRRGPMRTPTTGTSVFFPQTYTGNGSATATFTNTGGFPPDWMIAKARAGDDTTAQTRLIGRAPIFLNSTNAEVGSGFWDDYFRIIPDQNSFYLGLNSRVNGAAANYINWMFRRAPGFFDVVCYTGTGAVRTVSHNLGVAPELWIMKSRSATGSWTVGSASLANTERLFLETTGAKNTSATTWNSTYPTSSVFSLGTSLDVNTSLTTYVAYLFASAPGVSKVGSYTGTGATQVINCGFAAGARFVLIKRTDSTGDWYVWDSARGIVAGNDPYLLLNSNAAEVTTTDWVDTAASGFELSNAAGNLVNTNGASYIFLSVS